MTGKRYWTKEKVTSSLSEIWRARVGMLPCGETRYLELKKINPTWPPYSRICEYYHSLAAAWRAAGANKDRIMKTNLDWAEEDDAYLIFNAGKQTLKEIASCLRRSYQATRARLAKTHHIQSRHNQHHISAAEAAKLFSCSYGRVLQYVKDGKIKGTYDPVRNRWEIYPGSVPPAVIRMLKKPRRTHKTWPIDRGDYQKRYKRIRHAKKEAASGIS
jgi:hypothetical protein